MAHHWESCVSWRGFCSVSCRQLLWQQTLTISSGSLCAQSVLPYGLKLPDIIASHRQVPFAYPNRLLHPIIADCSSYRFWLKV